MSNNLKAVGLALAALGLIQLFLTYSYMPAYAAGFMGHLQLGGVITALVSGLLISVLGKQADSRIQVVSQAGIYLVVGAIGFSLTAVGLMATNSGLFKHEEYRALVQVKQAKLSKEQPLPGLDLRNAPLVSSEMASLIAYKKLSEIPALGSQVDLGIPAKQLVNGKLVWVLVMEHSSLFRWIGNDTTPGYVVVSATDASDVKLVTELNGKPLKLRYLHSGWLGDNVRRHVYFNGHMTHGVQGLTIELDDTGKPYMVGSVYKKTLGLEGQVVTGVVVVDPETGAIANYTVASAPAWIDLIQQVGFVQGQISDWGDLVHGWFNWSGKDKLMPSTTPDLVYSKGRAYYYVGLTSMGRNDDAINGFMLVDSRTKETTYYEQPGVMEETAQKVVEQVMPEKNYKATNALPFAVNGEVVYVMGLQDSSGIARGYGLVSLADYQKMAVAETLADAYRLYTSKVSGKASLELKASAAKVVGTVRRIAAEVKSGNTYYYLVLEGDPRVFVGGSGLGESLALTRVQDTVELSIQDFDTNRGTANILAFNLKTL